MHDNGRQAYDYWLVLCVQTQGMCIRVDCVPCPEILRKSKKNSKLKTKNSARSFGKLTFFKFETF